MTEETAVPDLPLVPQLIGGAVGQAAFAVATVAVVLREDRDGERLLMTLALMAVVWCVWVLLTRACFHRPVVREPVRRVPGPVRPNRRRLRVQIGRRVIVAGALWAVLGYLLSALGALTVLPGMLLGLAGFELLGIRDVRRWQADQGVRLFTRTGSSPWARPAGPRDSDRILAVVGPRPWPRPGTGRSVETMRPLIEIPAADGTAEALVARPDNDPHPGVLLWMDAIGLRPRIEEMADRIASWGYIVLAPNTFYRLGTVAETSPPADMDLTDPEQRAEFMAVGKPRVATLTKEATEADVPHYVAALRSLPGVADGPIGVTGYCMGAKHATRAACVEPDIAAVGGFHGAQVATAEPDSPHLGLGAARAAFVYGHADHDEAMPPEMVERLDAALAEHGLEATTAVYPEAPHGYTMSDTASYQEAGAERHFAELRELFDRVLRGDAGRGA